jgi:hypothetical protein
MPRLHHRIKHDYGIALRTNVTVANDVLHPSLDYSTLMVYLFIL